MSQAAERDVCFKASGARERMIDGSDVTDRRILSAWLDQAGTDGIDTVLDLGVRPWNIAGAGAIFGVFETHRDQASWLIVQYGPGWILARCADGFISEMSVSLADILRLIDTDLRVRD